MSILFSCPRDYALVVTSSREAAWNNYFSLYRKREDESNFSLQVTIGGGGGFSYPGIHKSSEWDVRPFFDFGGGPIPFQKIREHRSASGDLLVLYCDDHVIFEDNDFNDLVIRIARVPDHFFAAQYKIPPANVTKMD